MWTKEKMGKRAISRRNLLALLAVTLFLAGAPQALCETSGKPRSLLKEADASRDALYRSRNKMKLRHHWQNCIDQYRELAKRYPESDEAAWALYKAGRMYVKLYGYSGREEDLDDAVELYRRLVAEHPEHRLADDAQYRIGEIFYQGKNDLTQAYVEFLKVDIRFPSGDMRPKARAMLDRLASILSRKETEGRVKESLSEGSDLTQVQNIRHWSTPNYTRVVIDLEKAVKYEAHLLKEDKDQKKPRRLYMDLQGAYVSSDIESSIPIRDGLLQRARAGQYSKDTVRVVLDINSISDYKVFPLHDPFRIVVDVQSSEPKEEPEKAAPRQETRRVGKGIRKPKEPDQSVSLARQLGLNVRKIVIDPGHGGKDPGCYFSSRLKEKHTVLELAKILAKKLEDKLGCEAVLTREKDIFLPLEKRTAFANMQKADLFISLHINAHKQPEVYGLETYFLNMATDERAVMVAARENATSEKNISDLQTILNDLMLNTKISESSKLAYDVQNAMVDRTRKAYGSAKDLGVKQAPFYVLIGAEMPAILVEVGFITNPKERKRLTTKAYLDNIAEGIASGVEGYMKGIASAHMRG